MFRAIVIDDNPDIASIACHAGKHAGIDVTVFSNGTDALKYLNDCDTCVDVVVLDLMMSPLDGLTVAEEIRRNEEIHLIKPPVLMAFLTAAEINEAIERVAERVGVKKIFRKPCDYVAAFTEIKSWLENRQ